MRTKLWIGSTCAAALLAIGAVWAFPRAEEGAACSSCNKATAATQPACCTDGCCSDCSDCCTECREVCAALGCCQECCAVNCPDCCAICLETGCCNCCATGSAARSAAKTGSDGKSCCAKQAGGQADGGCCKK